MPAMNDEELEAAKEHLFNREFMGGVERDTSRVKETGEVFTPTWLVEKMLDRVGEDLVNDPSKRIIDTSCGDGQFLVSVLYRRLKAGVPIEEALATIFGVELMEDNARICRDRLMCGREEVREIVERNIVCADGLKYHMRFDGTDPNQTEKDLLFDELFS